MPTATSITAEARDRASREHQLEQATHLFKVPRVRF